MGSPNAEVPEWSCEDNSLKAAPLNPYHNPLLFSMLKHGHFGGLPQGWEWFSGLDENEVWTRYALREYSIEKGQYWAVLPYDREGFGK